MEYEIVKGSDLKVGDTIAVWWSSNTEKANQDKIVKLSPYEGNLKYLFPYGAKTAKFLSGYSMTIDMSDPFKKFLVVEEV